MEKKFNSNAPVPMEYTLTTENELNYHMNLIFNHKFTTEFAHCSIFNPIIPNNPEKQTPIHRGYDFDFTAAGMDSAEYTALRIIQHFIGCIMNKLVRIVNAQSHNVGISTDSPLLLAEDVPICQTDYSEDISAKHDNSISGFTLMPRDLVLDIRVPVEPCFEMDTNEPFEIELFIICGIPENKTYSGVLTACSAIKALKEHMTNTLSYVGNRIDDVFVG